MEACSESLPRASSIERTYPVHTGKVLKGYTGPTVPYKHNARVIPNSEKKGFNSQAKRFQYNKDESPGPGFYSVIHRSPEFNSTSLSKKGTGYFPSGDTRIARNQIPSYPAANAYSIASCFQSKRDFGTGNSSMFQQPIARKLKKMPTPAPNQYNASTDFCKQSNNVCAWAAFVSKTARGLSSVTAEKWPSPCHYSINVSLTQRSPNNVMSCFKSKTPREVKVDSCGPGPAAYSLRDLPKVAKKTCGLCKYGLNFSAAAIPPPKDPPLPGPGQYDVVDYKDPPKQCISSAVFVSNTGRWAGDQSREGLPGPGTYWPHVPEKQSFLCNADKKWVPVL
ncbi:O(6)-methylguanine-induced apoptosis 2 [Alligator mississippiensis]|uniref:O(6)-methylguanine-induced apoptosis 2 n=1 Tax=Alligator mississippiensis TaxID=8496 RepID=UPI0003D079C0|nr:O(6)-methylguanine-induced apoptosis 2 [Alligator mississippiensis]